MFISLNVFVFSHFIRKCHFFFTYILFILLVNEHQKSGNFVANMRLPTIQELGVFEDNPPLYRPIPVYPIHMKVRQTDHVKFKRSQTRNSARPYCVAPASERNSSLWT